MTTAPTEPRSARELQLFIRCAIVRRYHDAARDPLARSTGAGTQALRRGEIE